LADTIPCCTKQERKDKIAGTPKAGAAEAEYEEVRCTGTGHNVRMREAHHQALVAVLVSRLGKSRRAPRRSLR
jgi:hypothetical protein